MKQLLLCMLLLAGSVQAAWAQTQKGERFERIHAAKVAYITDKLSLSSDQSARFWPVYDRYESEIRDLRKRFLGEGQKSPATDPESRRFIDDNFDFQEQQLALKRRYKDEFLKILTPTQLASLYIAEREFKRLLLEKLKDYGPETQPRR